ncbi:hypothetical protein BDV96DRAFT_653667 [Lophiotrema nucula]|uniref:6-methylsalicylic acid synthase n=1 Tax=Lophiotrema nucula TaxID=690887 RepID=A0A6A5YN42_9PLEO|nr:hypothetical protein BDV96DRAFT_653667 [Lophiotrema nucula]
MSSAFEVVDWALSPKSSPHIGDVAIVGISCRTAGGNDTPEKLWEFLLDKKDASGEVPKQRWEPWIQRDQRNAKVIENITSKGYFMEGLEDFDAGFFGISPKEAELMDPHQRLALELSREALENAGLDVKGLAGSDTAVFMGVDSDDYSRLLLEDLPNIEAWSGIGTAYHGIPNRVSYHFDFMGPSTAVDAACASSLIAVHLGRQAVLSGESNVALVGGVNVLCAPALTHMLDKAGALAPDGICRSFDDTACGYARGEGGAIIILKKLSSAVADNDNILAVLKGSATAQDGKTNGIFAPNAKAQEMVARKALSTAGNLDPLTIGYVEAHATSTSLGDPIEVGAISRVYGVGRPKGALCAIGSIKPNVGHLEAAAGAIGLVKAIISVHKAQLAPQTRLNKLNTRIDWKNSGLDVVKDVSPWPDTGGLRRAAVCSYGYGGSVSHAIIEQASPAYIATHASGALTAEPRVPVALVVTASQEKRLALQANQLAKWLSTGPASSLTLIANTLARRRAHYDHRATFVVESFEDAVSALATFADGHSREYIASGRVFSAATKKSVVWVFSGHGAQWPDMGKALLQNDIFRKSVASLDPIVQEEAGFSALESLETGDLGSSERIQVLTFLVQYGLSELLKSKGVRPQAIVGHSVGEIAATVAAGCLTPEEGTIIVTRRALLYARVKGKGGMALVNLSWAQVVEELEGRTDLVAAIHSSPTSAVISGQVESLEVYLTGLRERKVQAFRVDTDIPFHSPMLDDLVEPLSKVLLRTICPRPAIVPLYSTSNADARTDVLRDTDYWVINMISPVHLHRAVEAAIDDGHRIFLEVSTHPIVTHSISETLAARHLEESAAIGIMKRNALAEKSILHAVSQLFTFGAAVDFRAQLGTSHWATDVPLSPWVHKPYWKRVETGNNKVAMAHDVDKHTLLGEKIDIAGTGTRVYTTRLDDKTKPYPLTHPLDGTEIIPAAVYCNSFRQATGASILSNLQLLVPVSMTSDLREVQVIVSADQVRLSSRLQPPRDAQGGLEHAWIDHSSCIWKKHKMMSYHTIFDIPRIKSRVGTQLSNGFAWDFLQKIGVSGIAFPWAVLEHYGNEKEMVVKMDMDPESTLLKWDENSWAPLLDAATSVGSSIFFNDPKMRIVSGIDEVLFISDKIPPKVGYLYIEKADDEKSLAAHISVLDEEGALLAKLQSMRFSDIEAGRNSSIEGLAHQMVWIPPRFSESPLKFHEIVLVSSEIEVAERYLVELRSMSNEVAHITSAEQLIKYEVARLLNTKGTIVIYIPGAVDNLENVPSKAHDFTWEAVNIIKELSASAAYTKLFIMTHNVAYGYTPTALAHAPLHGFARIAAQEHPDVWGALIDNEGPQLPLLALKYVQGQDVIRMQDGLPRVARLRPFSRAQRHDPTSTSTLLPKPEGTYIITGGHGDLGLEVCQFLVKKGARRLVLMSRRALPPRRQWDGVDNGKKKAVKVIRHLESKGATVHSLALDIGAPGAVGKLQEELDRLSLPKVLGVVHAAGVSEDNLIVNTTPDSFARVFEPKVSGALALHHAFPPNTLDFFVLFSSIGQIVGTSGQSPYGAANAFLDTLATHRRQLGDNAVAFQWTAWRGLGLAADAEFLTVELESKGITDITSEEAFQAWEHVGKYDIDHAVVSRAKLLDADEPCPIPLLEEIAPRRPRSAQVTSSELSTKVAKDNKPSSGPELRAWLTTKVRESLGAVLHITDLEDIDVRSAVSDLGVDSVMTVSLRQKLQSVLGVKVPPTLTWNCPTIGHLVEWFYEKISVELKV